MQQNSKYLQIVVKPEVSDINPMYFPKISDTRGFGLNPTNFKGLDAKGTYIQVIFVVNEGKYTMHDPMGYTLIFLPLPSKPRIS